MNTYIGHNQFQNILHCVAKLCKNWPRGVEKSVGGSRIRHTASTSTR